MAAYSSGKCEPPPPSAAHRRARGGVELTRVDEQAHASGLGPPWSGLREPWLAQIGDVFAEAGLTIPPPTRFRSTGRRGVHSEHMGYILAEMQVLQRTHPGGRW